MKKQHYNTIEVKTYAEIVEKLSGKVSRKANTKAETERLADTLAKTYNDLYIKMVEDGIFAKAKAWDLYREGRQAFYDFCVMHEIDDYSMDFYSDIKAKRKEYLSACNILSRNMFAACQILKGVYPDFHSPYLIKE